MLLLSLFFVVLLVVIWESLGKVTTTNETRAIHIVAIILMSFMIILLKLTLNYWF